MSALDDKDVQTAKQWEAAVQFMSSSLKKQIRVAEEEMQRMEGPTSYYDRWIRWKGQNELEIKRQAVANELNNFLRAEPVRVCVCLRRISFSYHTRHCLTIHMVTLSLN